MSGWTPPGPAGPGAQSSGAQSSGAQWSGHPPPTYPPPPPPVWSPYAAPPPPRPGIIPLRPLGVGELLDGAFTAMRRHPRATLGLSALVATVQQVLALVVDLSTNGYASPSTNGFAALGTVSGLLTFALNAILSAVLLGMLSVVIADAVIGRDISLRDVWRRVRPLLTRLVGAAFLAAVLPWFGLIALVVGGVFLWVALSFTTPALVLERLTVRQSLRRSWELTVPAFWRVLGIRLLAMIIAGVIGSIISIPAIIIVFASITNGIAGGGSVDLGLGAEILVRVVALVSATITAPITAGVLALLYIDRRMRAEALDVTLVQATTPAA